MCMRQPVAEEIEVKICLKIEIDPLNFVFNEDIFFQRVHLRLHNHLNLLNLHYHNHLNHNVPNTPLPPHLIIFFFNNFYYHLLRVPNTPLPPHLDFFF